MIGVLAIAGALAAAPTIESCYDLPATRQLRAVSPQPANLEAAFLVDESVALPGAVREQMLAAVDRLAVPGGAVSVGSFSSYAGTRYPRIVLTVRFDTPLPKAMEGSVSRRARDLLARCIEWRRRDGVSRLRAALAGRLAAARPSIAQSDIMGSLQQFGSVARDRRYRERVVVVGSDMIENSSSASFYRAGRLGQIDPGRELANASRRGLLADLGGARVYLVGVAFQPGEGVVPVDHVQRLERFWVGYLKASGASSVQVGKPLMLAAIR